MTTYTSLLSGDPYMVEDWLVTIREYHTNDLPQMNGLRKLIRSNLDLKDSYYRSRIVASYKYLLGGYSAVQAHLNRSERQVIERALSIFEQELRQ
jgi:hypothetical protein